MFAVIVNGKEFLVKFSHNIFWENSKVRSTSCFINGTIMGTAYCNPKDTFNKVRGRKLALTRALKALHLNKEQRKLFWEEYFKKVTKK